MLLAVVVVPELRRDEDVLALDEPLLNRPTNALSGLLLVLVVVCAIEQPVADLDSLELRQSLYHRRVCLAGNLTLYTVSAAWSAGTFQRPKPTSGMLWPEASWIVVFAIFL
jgi:hypothetical protein